MNNPTALIIYNRPKHLLRVLNALRSHKPEPLYIFSDGPKDDPKDIDQVAQVRRLLLGEKAKGSPAHIYFGLQQRLDLQESQTNNTIDRANCQIDWTHPVIVPQAQNRGLAWSVVHAVDYVLERHDTVIVLEDDCLPGPWFLEFMTQCLACYADDQRVIGVNGWTMPLPEPTLRGYPYDLYFNPRIHCWGWATWRRAWALYERDLGAALSKAGRMGVDLNQGGRDVQSMIRARIRGKLDAWTGGWILAAYINKSLYAYPTASHVQNIGMDGSGVHCPTTGKWNTPLSQTKPTRYPDSSVLHRPILDHFMSYYGGYSKR